jgi:hypothetical protein
MLTLVVQNTQRSLSMIQVARGFLVPSRSDI